MHLKSGIGTHFFTLEWYLAFECYFSVVFGVFVKYYGQDFCSACIFCKPYWEVGVGYGTVGYLYDTGEIFFKYVS